MGNIDTILDSHPKILYTELFTTKFYYYYNKIAVGLGP